MPHFRIYAATTDDINQGWVWIGLPAIPQRGLIRLENPKTGKVVYCEALRIDTNFLHTYNKPGRSPIEAPESALVANEWYRSRLGGIETKTEVELEVIVVDDPSSSVLAALHHPQVVVRIATILALWGIFLGVAAIVLAIVSICKQ